MYADAGNEYMGKSMTADIHLDVKQYTYEQDGFGNPNYDEDATYPEKVVTPGMDASENGKMLRAAIDGAKDGETVAVAAGTYSFDQALVINKEIKLVGTGDVVLDFSDAAAPKDGGYNTSAALVVLSNDVTLNGVTIIGNAALGSVVAVGVDGITADLEDNEITVSDDLSYKFEWAQNEFSPDYKMSMKM